MYAGEEVRYLLLLLLLPLSVNADMLDVLQSKKKKQTIYFIETRDAEALRLLGYKLKAFKWEDKATACEYCPKPIPSGCCDADGVKRRIGYEVSK